MDQRICWICFSSAAETPASIPWVSPCACSGDTQWSHEPCLLTWIVRQQQQQGDGEGRRRVLLDSDEQEVDDAIACPQCAVAYRVQMGQKTGMQVVVQQVHDLYQSVIDVAVPYLSLVGSSYVIIISSVTYGVYAVSTLCGPTDPLTRSLHNDRWPLTYWTRLFVLPWTLLLSRIQAFETSLASLGTVSLALSWSWPYIRSWMLEEDPQPAVGPFFGSSAGTLSLSELWSVRQRWVWGWWVVKRYYAQFYRHVVLPLIVGQRRHPLSDSRHDEGSESRRRTHHSTPSTTATTTTTLSSTSTTSNTNANNSTTETAVWDTALTDYADYDVYFGDDQPSSLTSTRISAYDLLQHVVGTWMLPALSATTGHLLQQWVAPKITSVSLDTFGWSMVGGCVLAVVKDLGRAVYHRQQRRLRSQMRVQNYQRSS